MLRLLLMLYVSYYLKFPVPEISVDFLQNRKIGASFVCPCLCYKGAALVPCKVCKRCKSCFDLHFDESFFVILLLKMRLLF